MADCRESPFVTFIVYEDFCVFSHIVYDQRGNCTRFLVIILQHQFLQLSGLMGKD